MMDVDGDFDEKRTKSLYNPIAIIKKTSNFVISFLDTIYYQRRMVAPPVGLCSRYKSAIRVLHPLESQILKIEFREKIQKIASKFTF